MSLCKSVLVSGATVVTGLANLVSGANSGTLSNPVTIQNALKNDYSLRTRIEQTEAEDTHLTKTTFGMAPWQDGHSRFKEVFRSYHYDGKQNGSNVDWDTYGLIIPKFNNGGLEHSISVFGETGDREGMGMEAITSFGKLDLYLNAEKSSSNDARRLGFRFEHNYGGTFNLGAGFDEVETVGGKTNYWSGKVVWNMDENHQLGGALRLSDNDTGTNRAVGYVMRHGKDISWGNRSFIVYDQKEDFENIWFRSTFAQNPTFSRNGSGPAFVGTNQGYIVSPHVVNSPVTTIEPPSTVERSSNGAALRIGGNISNTDGLRKGHIGTEVGYQFGGNFGVYGYSNNGIGGVEDSYGVHAVARLGKYVKLEVDHDFKGEDTWASASMCIPLGKKE